jgi:hypothetical protein
MELDANNLTGEVWRPVRPISAFSRLVKTCPVWVVSPHIVNSSRNASLELDVHCDAFDEMQGGISTAAIFYVQ